MQDAGETEIEAFEGTFVRTGHRLPGAWNELTHSVIGCAMRVHSALGPGLPERLYATALLRELSRQGVACQTEVIVRVTYEGEAVGDLRIDLLVANLLVVELKAVESVHPLHLAQLVAYMRAGRYPLGLLINFNVLRLKEGIFRRINSSVHPP